MKSLENFYDNDYHDKVHENLFGDEIYFWARAKVFNRLYFAEREKSLNVLDYGCGLGQASACLKGAYGYDASSQARDFAEGKGLKVFSKTDEIPREHFDIVICRHVLEHVPNPLEVLTLQLSLLKQGGRLKLILPKERHSRSATFTPDNHMHLYSWNFRNINNLLSVAGFEVVVNREFYHWGFAKLMPIYKLFGLKIYESVTRLVGVVTRTSELYIEAVKK
jgi:SAM-dependent methyltransferase